MQAQQTIATANNSDEKQQKFEPAKIKQEANKNNERFPPSAVETLFIKYIIKIIN